VSQPYNPYAPPQSDNASPPGGPPPPGQPQSWEINEVLTLAWERFKENWVVLVAAQFIYLLITQAISQGIVWTMSGSAPADPDATGLRHSGANLGVTAIATVASMIVGAFLNVGLQRIFLAVARGGSPSLGVLFGGGDRFIPLLGATLLVGLASALGLVLLIVPGIIVALALCFTQLYVIDSDRGPVEAMRASWDATQGHKGSLFLLGLASFGVMLLGALACCVGMIAAMPVCYVAMAIVYTRLSGTTAAPAGAMS
jgi:uncharacterized membrane protein